jgi:serine/threonine-protein kinase
VDGPSDDRVLPDCLGPFRITGVLGEGGSATVYAAHRDATSLALKVPHATDSLTPKEQRRFLQEAEMLARVHHPAIIEVLDAGTLPDGRPFVAMPRHDGETLADRLERGPLDRDHALGLFDELADAVAVLHDEGLLHRDLKPENILLVDAERHVKLLDFGIAKDVAAPASTTTQAGMTRGTPAVMAPERFFGSPASIGTDVYELAVVLYVMLVGRLPWPDSDAAARLAPALPADLGVALPSKLSDAMMQSLSTRPEVRPASVREFAARIREAALSTEMAPSRVTANVPCTAESKVPATSGSVQVLDMPRSSTQPLPWRLLGATALGMLTVATTVTVIGIGWFGDPVLVESPVLATSPVLSEEALEPAEPALSANPPLAVSAPSAPVPEDVTRPAPSGDVKTAPARSKPSVAAPTASATTESPPRPASVREGKPKGASCTRSSECASMLCAAEACQ